MCGWPHLKPEGSSGRLSSRVFGGWGVRRRGGGFRNVLSVDQKLQSSPDDATRYLCSKGDHVAHYRSRFCVVVFNVFLFFLLHF